MYVFSTPSLNKSLLHEFLIAVYDALACAHTCETDSCLNLYFIDFSSFEVKSKDEGQ
jgi:hypothetical protein